MQSGCSRGQEADRKHERGWIKPRSLIHTRAGWARRIQWTETPLHLLNFIIKCLWLDAYCVSTAFFLRKEGLLLLNILAVVAGWLLTAVLALPQGLT